MRSQEDGWTANCCVHPWSCLFNNLFVVLFTLLQDAAWNNICGSVMFVLTNHMTAAWIGDTQGHFQRSNPR